MIIIIVLLILFIAIGGGLYWWFNVRQTNDEVDNGGDTGDNTGDNTGGDAGGDTGGGNVGGDTGGDAGGDTGDNTGGDAGGDTGGNKDGTGGVTYTGTRVRTQHIQTCDRPVQLCGGTDIAVWNCQGGICRHPEIDGGTMQDGETYRAEIPCPPCPLGKISVTGIRNNNTSTVEITEGESADIFSDYTYRNLIHGIKSVTAPDGVLAALSFSSNGNPGIYTLSGTTCNFQNPLPVSKIYVRAKPAGANFPCGTDPS